MRYWFVCAVLGAVALNAWGKDYNIEGWDQAHFHTTKAKIKKLYSEAKILGERDDSLLLARPVEGVALVQFFFTSRDELCTVYVVLDTCDAAAVEDRLIGRYGYGVHREGKKGLAKFYVCARAGASVAMTPLTAAAQFEMGFIGTPFAEYDDHVFLIYRNEDMERADDLRRANPAKPPL